MSTSGPKSDDPPPSLECRCRSLQRHALPPEVQRSCYKHPPSKYTKPSCSEGSSSMSNSHASESAAAVLAGMRLILEAEPELAICSCWGLRHRRDRLHGTS